MRTKENNHLSKYYTNNSIRGKIDKINQRINEGICPILNALDCKESERRKLTAEKNRLENEIKKLDLEYWESVFKVDKT